MRPPIIQFRCRDGRASGFTLVEILIVVVILGILAAIVLPGLSTGAQEAEEATFRSNLRQYAQAFMLYHEKNCTFPPDGLPTEVPPGMDGYMDGSLWSSGKPLGGQWDWDCGVFGITAGVSVEQPARTDAQMTELDRQIDDGDLTTGQFRKRTNGFIYILEP
ncbi:MAG TPA: type II secretion system protein [Tepidisphaeraceae bacterium]|nr:type II secretion system protein [Tepidisphaeraceae bacterium]